MSARPEYDLFGNSAFPSKVISTHKTAGRFDLFSGMGHGGPDEFEGQSGLNIYDLKDSSGANYTVRGAIVHLYSCDCGQKLGPHLVTNGAKAFIGYTRPVQVANSQAIEEDFVRVSAVIDRSILGGDSSATTRRKADAEFASVKARLLASATASPRDVAGFRLNHRSMVGPWLDPTGRKYGSY